MSPVTGGGGLNPDVESSGRWKPRETRVENVQRDQCEPEDRRRGAKKRQQSNDSIDNSFPAGSCQDAERHAQNNSEQHR
jgi:hypothetical protein